MYNSRAVSPFSDIKRSAIEAQVSQSEKAYQMIKEKIVTLELKPLTVLDELRLMDDLQLGRTPVREALHRLETESLVIIAPRRGMFVANISITDLQKIFELRIPFEGYCVQLAAQRATEAQLAQMEELVRRPDGLINAQVRELMDVDMRLHKLMYEASDNEILADVLSRLYTLSQRLWYLGLDRLADFKVPIENHREIVQALRARNGALAERLIQQHIESFQQAIKAVIA
jgi:DNA-binding GntR family transcriptional regulator